MWVLVSFHGSHILANVICFYAKFIEIYEIIMNFNVNFLLSYIYSSTFLLWCIILPTP